MASKSSIRSGLRATAGSAGALLVALASITTAQQQNTHQLFEVATQSFAANALPGDTVLERRLVRVNVAALGSLEPRTASADRPETVSLDLLDKGQVTAVMNRVDLLESGRTAWVGRIADDEYGTVTLVIDRDAGIVTGSITSPEGSYRLQPAGGGLHVLSKLDPAGDRGDIVVEPPETDHTIPDTQASDDGSRIDVMVVYTPAARNAAGGTAAIEGLIDLSITETNQSYTNSGITPRVRLVYKGEVSYTETGDFATDLSRLRNTADGYIDSVHTLRDQYGADMVSMVIEGTQYCGIAYTIGGPSTSNAPNAFQVTARNCATGYYSMGHEFGHLQGARHDWYVDSTNNSPYTYNHGYYPPSKSWRTVMAYADGCGGCTRIQWWSNPTLTRNGEVLGIAEGQSYAADNRKTLNNTAYYVANFRAEVGGTKAAMTSPTPGSVLSGTTVTFSWDAGKNVTQYWLYVGTLSPGAQNIYNSSTGTTRSVPVSGLPTNGSKVYVRLWSLIGSWQYTDYEYTASQAACTPTSMTSPSPGITLAGTTVTFTWAGNPCATQYWLSVGTGALGAYNIYNASTGTSTSVAVNGLPNNGSAVYVRLWTYAGSWTYVDYTYTAYMRVCTAAALTTPPPGSTLTATTVTFTWTANACATQYWLSVGTVSQGAYNIYDSSTGTNTSASVSGLPKSGGKVYVRLWTYAGSWTYVDYEYTALTAALARMQSPATGSLLTGTRTVFVWNTASGVTEHWLYVGTSRGGADLYSASQGLSLSGAATGIPTATCSVAPVLTSPAPGSALSGAAVTFTWTTPCTGPTIWVRLWSKTASGWDFEDYSYGVTGYKFDLGTTFDGNNLFNGTEGPNASVTVNSLPVAGEKTFATLWWLQQGAWKRLDTTFTASGSIAGFTHNFNAPGPLTAWEAYSGDWLVDPNGTAVTYGIPSNGSSVGHNTVYSTLDYSVVMMRDGAANIYANRLYVRGESRPLEVTDVWHEGYLFQYTSAGMFSVWKNVAGIQAIPLQDWTSTSAIVTGANWNTLRVKASGQSLSFYINGTLVWTGSDASFASGHVGVGFYHSDWLRVDSATLSTTIVADDNVVSPEQRELNDLARTWPSGNIDVSAPGTDGIR